MTIIRGGNLMVGFKKYSKSYSAHNQESFVLNVLQEKQNGYYVEIGAGAYQAHSNT